MSHPTDPPRTDAAASVHGTRHELRRRGNVFGVGYDVGVRITELSEPGAEPSRPPRLPDPLRLALPASAESPGAPAPDGTARGESEGGR